VNQYGPRIRRLVREAQEHLPSDDERREMGSRLRAVAHIILRAARRTEEGDLEALGEMAYSEEVRRFAEKVIVTSTLAEKIVNDALSADAEEN
jgi:hypothetical protein